MRVELPLCTRCCFCLPLRYGLIIWGYVRLVISALVMVGAEKSLSKTIELSRSEPDVSYKIYAVLFGLLLVSTLADIILNIMFVIGGHRKMLKLLRAYYVYSIFLWITTALIGLGLTSYTVYWYNLQEIDQFRTWVLLVDVATFLAQIMIQAYFLLLIRSKIKKIKKTNEFRLRIMSITSAAQCMLHSEEDINHEDKSDICEDGTRDQRDLKDAFAQTERND